MRSLSLVLLLLLGFLMPLSAQAAGPEPETAIRKTIIQQLNAFQRDDWVGAFAYASPLLQSIFGSPERFREMVLGGYRVVYRHKQAAFRDLDTSGPRPVQNVFFIDPDGLAYLAAYEMARQTDGTWRIAGVQLFRAEAKSV